MSSKPLPSEMTLLEHLRVLRHYVFIATIALGIGAIISFMLYEPLIMKVLWLPFESVNSDQEATLYITSLLEGFVTKIKVSLLCGLVISFPIMGFLGIKFLFPAMHRHEKKILFVGLAVSALLIVVGVYLSFFKIIPYSVAFLTHKGFVPAGVGMLLGYHKNVFYILQFMFFGLLMFQLPVVMLLLLMMNVLSRRRVFGLSRYFVLGIFVLSAIITPPDPVSQISFALPLIGLFYLTLLLAKIANFGTENG